MAMPTDLVTWVLDQNMPPDDSGVSLKVHHISAEGDPALLGRLEDLGLGPFEEILYFGRAPLGEPIYISVRETVLALRLMEARLIFVTRVVP